MIGRMNSAGPERRDPRRGPLGYYWFITFEHASDLHSLTEELRQAIDTTYFAPVSMNGLHLTLDRIAYIDECTPEQLDSIAAAARRACKNQPPFSMMFEQLGNLCGAIGFKVSPAERVRGLRDELRSATISVLPEAPIKGSSSDPHVTVAYPVGEDLSAMAAATADRMSTMVRRVDVTVSEAVMVLLERRRHGYWWKEVTRIPLGK
ncbi:2'-5' RNA ligase family protein [Nocardia amikacinitolerans]|uniref:2'-5' RNA ligase family protein n=1 Tax=Nocardia amikacinitolerans TaxID=756689 RepID=UPI0020A4ADE8|nr:2'-5' RNA ligase family protein [Nocardia amikacinitolerans]